MCAQFHALYDHGHESFMIYLKMLLGVDKLLEEYGLVRPEMPGLEVFEHFD